MGQELENYINKKLTNRAINKFDPNLVKDHKLIPHDIHKIPAGYTIMDALCYIFNDNAMPIADVLQSYVDNVQNTIELLDALEDGIVTKSICLTCVKDSVYAYKQ